MSSTEQASPSAAGADVVNEVVAAFDKAAEAAERIFWEMSEGDLPTSAQKKVLRLAGIHTRNDLNREISRVATIKRWLVQAGTAAEKIAAEQAAVTAVRNENERRPALEKQIAQLQAELDELIGERERSREVLRVMTEARERLCLPHMLPAHVREACESDAAVARRKYHATISELESQVNLIKGLQAMDLSTHNGVVLAKRYCESANNGIFSRVDPRKPGQQGNLYAIEEFHSDAFERHRGNLVASLPAVEAELQEAIKLRDAEVAKANRLSDYYIDRIV